MNIPDDIEHSNEVYQSLKVKEMHRSCNKLLPIQKLNWSRKIFTEMTTFTKDNAINQIQRLCKLDFDVIQ